MTIRYAFAIAFALLPAACVTQAADVAAPSDAGSSDPDAAASADGASATVDATVPDTFTPAPHTLLQVPDQGGAKLAAPQVAVVTFADDTNRPALEDYGSQLAKSSWLKTVGAEYGIGPATFLGAVRRKESAPKTVTDADIVAMLNAGIKDGSVPRAPDATLENVVYLVFFPSTTVISGVATAAGKSCENFGGYHLHAKTSSGSRFAYAVIPTCPSLIPAGLTAVQANEVAASHEFVEAATDPYPLDKPAWRLPDVETVSAWVALGGEVADLCELDPHSNILEGNAAFVRVWSNIAAKAKDRDPCVPAPSKPGPYYNNVATPDEVHRLSAGESFDYKITGWSNAPVEDWALTSYAAGSAQPTVTFSRDTLNNGLSATATVTMPANVPHDSYTYIYLYAEISQTDYQIWPLATYTP